MVACFVYLGENVHLRNRRMSELSWWALSPSPFSIIFYFILIAYAYQKIRGISDTKSIRRKLVVLTDAMLIVGFVVVFMDTIWIVVCGLRFGWFFPNSVLQLILASGRNVAGLVFCYMLIGDYFKQGIIKFTETTALVLFMNVSFLIFWFVASPSPAFTDWTFALRHDYPFSVVLSSLFISHVVGKSLVAILFYTLWRKKKETN